MTARWTCADGRKLLPSEMADTHKINCIRLYARRFQRRLGMTYELAAATVCLRYDVLGEMAELLIRAGKDPFKDYGGILVGDADPSTFPTVDYFRLSGEPKDKPVVFDPEMRVPPGFEKFHMRLKRRLQK